MTTERSKFAHANVVPPTGYIYAQEHEGTLYTFQSPTWTDLKGKLRSWYRSKNLEWPGDDEMRARMEEFVCARLGPGFCVGKTRRIGRVLSASSILGVTRIMLARAFKGDKGVLVPPEEAERRAKICVNCTKNLHGICTSCAGNEFGGVLAWLISGNRSTQYDQYLDTCEPCGCLLRAKVHVSLDELAKTPPQSYPENCWLYGTKCHRPKKEGESE